MDNPAPPAQALWDWQANIMAAYDLLMEKWNSVNNHLNACQKNVNQWTDVGRPIISHSDVTEGDITYTHASSPNFNHAINGHLGAQPSNNKRSFIDACWMKLYNGKGDHHYYWLAPSKTENGIEYPPEWHICDYARYDNYVNYYVREVSARETP
jgi:hypothetical protein